MTADRRGRGETSRSIATAWRQRATELLRREDLRPGPADLGGGALRMLRLAVALFALAGVLGAATALSGAVRDVRLWRAGAEVATREASAGALFGELARAELLGFDFERFRIRVAPADLALRRRLTGAAPADGWPAELEAEAALLLERLHGGRANGPGAVLLSEIAAWNAAHAVAAVRDDRPALLAQTSAPLAILPIGAKPARWDAAAVAAEQGAETPLPAAARAGLSPDLFGHLGWENALWPAPDGQWIAASAARDAGVAAADGIRVRFATRIAAEDEVTVDVVGADPIVDGAEILRRRPLCRARADLRRLPDPATRSLVERVVAERLPDPDCGPERLADREIQGAPNAHRLVLRPTPAAGRIRISVVPAPQIPERMRRFQRARFAPGGVPPSAPRAVVYQGGESIVLRCAAAETRDARPVCGLDWAPRARREPLEPPPLGLETADGAQLLTVEGDPTDAAAELGLVSLAGLGREDRFGAGGALHRAADAQPRALRLSLRADLQRIAQKLLRERVVTAPDRAFLPESHDGARRAALILLDASDERARRGEVLAAVDFPTASLRGGAAWNLLGRDIWRPLASPLAPRAWSRVDAAASPGSTLKPLVALALIRAAAERETEEDGPAFLTAVRGADDYQKAPGLPLPPGAALLPSGAVEVPGTFWARETHDCVSGRSGRYGWRTRAKICNFVFEGRLEAHDYGHLPPAVTGCPIRPGGAPDRKQLGLCEATLTSLNSWFGATALALDGDRILRRRPPGLTEFADALPPEDRRDLLRLDAPAAARFRLDPVALESARPTDNPLHTLALNAIGQNAQAAPLTVAALYGSIASGCRLAPRLTSLGERDCPPLFWGETTDPLEREWESRAQELMRAHLVPGLAGVVASPRGTADAAFRDAPYLAHLRGKTGTAEVPIGGGARVNTVWFAGWIEPEALTGAADALRGRRLAFACMVSHGRSGAASGGRVCAPIVRALLDDLTGAHSVETAPDETAPE